jgi:hypothetical protein
MSVMNPKTYVIEPEGMPNCYFCGREIGFADIEISAIKYVSLPIAQQAAKMLQAEFRRDFPRHRRLVAVELKRSNHE